MEGRIWGRGALCGFPGTWGPKQIGPHLDLRPGPPKEPLRGPGPWAGLVMLAPGPLDSPAPRPVAQPGHWGS